MTGTLDYLAPEIVDHKPYDSTVDNWCIGILTYEFLCGYPPFESKNKEETYERIRTLDLRFPPHVSEEAEDFIRKLLVLDPKGRMLLKDALNHPWIKKYENYAMTGSL